MVEYLSKTKDPPKSKVPKIHDFFHSRQNLFCWFPLITVALRGGVRYWSPLEKILPDCFNIFRAGDCSADANHMPISVI